MLSKLCHLVYLRKNLQDVHEVSDKLLHLLNLEAWVTCSVSGKKKLYVLARLGGTFVFHDFGNLRSRSVSKFILLGHKRSIQCERNGGPH